MQLMKGSIAHAYTLAHTDRHRHAWPRPYTHLGQLEDSTAVHFEVSLNSLGLCIRVVGQGITYSTHSHLH